MKEVERRAKSNTRSSSKEMVIRVEGRGGGRESIKEGVRQVKVADEEARRASG